VSILDNQLDFEIKELFSIALRVRRVEEEIAREYDKGNMRCPVHLSIGQEVAAALIGALRNSEDSFVSSHRSHAHYLSVGGKLNEMIAEIYGKVTGCSKGRGGSMHLFDREAGFLGSSAIVGNSIPIGTGLALSNKLKNREGLTFIFFGDGATEEGVFYESLNFAALQSLPAVYVCENNRYSVYTSLSERQPPNRSITRVAESLGLHAIEVDDRDPVSAFERIAIELTKTRKLARPLLIEINTYRSLEHCGPNDDDHLDYRPVTEIEHSKRNDPLIILRDILMESNLLDLTQLQEEESRIQAEILEAFKFAEVSAFPTLSDVLDPKS